MGFRRFFRRPTFDFSAIQSPQSLRAFRRAEVIFDAVLFESCVGGVAVAMTFSSIFHFKFWFRRGVVLAAFLGALWVLRASLGFLGGSFGGPWGDFLGSLEVLLIAVGCLGRPLGGPWGFLGRSLAPGERFPGFSGKLGMSFWLHVWVLLGRFYLV